LLALATLSTGCKKQPQPPPPPQKAKPAQKAKAAQARKPEAKTPKKKVRITPEQRTAFLKHLNEGRGLARERRWANAIKSFEAALQIIPADGVALGELGWAAFQIGSFEKARSANGKAVLMAAEPRIKAAALYNLGRTAEAMGDKEEAALYYSRSLHLRPNKTVARRLAKLGTKDPRPGIGLERSQASCVSAAEPKGLCPCLEKWAKITLAGGKKESWVDAYLGAHRLW
jgi:tetratricopeptide (TPR) repeat protein